MIPLYKIMDGLRVKVDPTAFKSPAYRERLLRTHPNLCTTIYRVRRGRGGEIFLEGLGSFEFESYLLNYAEGIHGFLSRESASGKWRVAEKGN
jgi:hypothetical protein